MNETVNPKFFELLIGTAADINRVNVSILEETAIKSALEVGLTAIVLSDVYFNAGLLKKLKLKVSGSFREQERVKLETILLATLVSADFGLNYFGAKPVWLEKYDTDKVIKVIFNNLVSRGIRMLDLPAFAVAKLSK